MSLKKSTASRPGDADTGYAAFTRWGDDGDNGVVVVIGSQLFFFTDLNLIPPPLRIRLVSTTTYYIPTASGGAPC
ncbi:MAG: hypothetical protein ACE5K8_05110 [Candidatus Zixiibacteriota bacterium]